MPVHHCYHTLLALARVAMQAEDQGGGPAPAAGPAADCDLTKSALGSLTPDQAMALAAAFVGQFTQQKAELAEQRPSSCPPPLAAASQALC